MKVFETISDPINRVLLRKTEQPQCYQDRHTVKLVHWVLSQGSFNLQQVRIEDIDQKVWFESYRPFNIYFFSSQYPQ